MKIAFIYGKKPSSTLTKIFTGSSCYHVGFTDGVKFWDMHLIRRRRLWSIYNNKKTVLIEAPVSITAEYLDHKLDTDDAKYGIIDYGLFGLRPIYHLFGKSTRNAGGLICSEMVADDLNANGWRYTFKEVPSPADLEYALGGKRDLWNNRD
ncbi:MAG: hypothetical protein INF44_04225 [Thalassospira sp.]|nr:hypothetical protein [Thalassospira sp.]